MKVDTAAILADTGTDGVKIASLGLRIRKGKSFHGLSFNINMDLEPFQRINPCGYEGLEVTQLTNFVQGIPIETVVNDLQQGLVKYLCAPASFVRFRV